MPFAGLQSHFFVIFDYMKKNNWKTRDGVVYSTDSDFSYNHASSKETETLPPAQQILKVLLDGSGRSGKQVTIVSGFIGTAADLVTLSKLLKTKCGVGGSAKDREILIQGAVCDKVVLILGQLGYKAKKSGC